MYKNPLPIKTRRVNGKKMTDAMARNTIKMVRSGARLYVEVLASNIAVWTGRSLASVLPMAQATGARVVVPSPTPSEQSVGHKENAYSGPPEGDYFLPDARSKRTFTVSFTSRVPYFEENDTSRNDFPSTPWNAVASAELALLGYVEERLPKIATTIALVNTAQVLGIRDSAAFIGLSNDFEDSEVPF